MQRLDHFHGRTVDDGRILTVPILQHPLDRLKANSFERFTVLSSLDSLHRKPQIRSPDGRTKGFRIEHTQTVADAATVCLGSRGGQRKQLRAVRQRVREAANFGISASEVILRLR